MEKKDRAKILDKYNKQLFGTLQRGHVCAGESYSFKHRKKEVDD